MCVFYKLYKSSSSCTQNNISVLESDGPCSEWWDHVCLVTEACKKRLQRGYKYNSDTILFFLVPLENTDCVGAVFLA